MRALIAILLMFMVGCVTPINDLEGKIPPKQFAHEYNRSVEAIKSHYFTPEAQKAIRDISCVSGFTVNGSYVVGANFWGTLAGIVTGSGYSRKCVMSDLSMKILGAESIIHEYIHHLDDFGRDDIEEFINIKEFVTAYIRMSKDPYWAGLVHYTEYRSNMFITNWFGLGPASEHIAWVAGRMAGQGTGPDYMWEVFRKVLKHE